MAYADILAARDQRHPANFFEFDLRAESDLPALISRRQNLVILLNRALRLHFACNCRIESRTSDCSTSRTALRTEPLYTAKASS